MAVNNRMDLHCLLSLYPVYNMGKSDMVVDAQWLNRNQGKTALILGKVTRYLFTLGTKKVILLY